MVEQDQLGLCNKTPGVQARRSQPPKYTVLNMYYHCINVSLYVVLTHIALYDHRKGGLHCLH